MLSDLSRYNSFQALGAPKHFRTFAFILFIFFIVVLLCLVFIPWQQTVVGLGRVTVFNPADRPQSIEAQISGRIKHWAVKEGQRVKAGELLVELEDIDPKYLSPSQLSQLETQKAALEQRLQALNNQLLALGQSQQASLPSAGIRVQQNRSRLFAAQQALVAAEQAEKTSQYNYERLKSLFDKGLRSRCDYELAELEIRRAQTEHERAKAQFDVAQ